MKTTDNSDKKFSRSIINKRDIVVTVLLLLAALGAYLFTVYMGRSENGRAVIYADGEVIKELPLGKDTVYRPDGYDIEFKVSDGGICVSDSGCKDKICIHRGYIHGSFETIVCLPQKITVRIINSNESNIDVELN